MISQIANRLALAVVAAVLVAGPADAAFNIGASHELKPRYLVVRDICRQWVEGNIRRTQYCDDGWLCDRQNPGKCKPGPEMQRKLDEEKRKRDEALAEERRRLEAQLRQLRANQRASGNLYPGRGNGSTSCSQITGAGMERQPCASDNTYDLSRGPPASFFAPKPARQPPPPPRPNPNQDMMNFAAIAGHLGNMLSQLPRNAPQRVGIEDALRKAATDYGGRGVDTSKALAALGNAGSPTSPSNGPAQTGATSPGTPGTGSEPGTPATGGPVAPTTEPAGTPAEPPPIQVSEKDDILCGFLIGYEEKDASRLAVDVPEFCKPYLRARGRTDVDRTQPPDPYRMAPLDTLDDLVEIRQIRERFEGLPVPPDFGQ